MDFETLVGERLRALRKERSLSQRGLAELSGLSPNAISLIERGEISPSVSTLQRLAGALRVRMGYFFEGDTETQVICKRRGDRPAISGRDFSVEGLGARLAGQQMDPFVITLAPSAGVGKDEVVHTGHELVHCLTGVVEYVVDGTQYLLEPGDQLFFRADLPHSWRYAGPAFAQFLLVLHATDDLSDPTRHHFAQYPSVTHLG